MVWELVLSPSVQLQPSSVQEHVLQHCRLSVSRSFNRFRSSRAECQMFLLASTPIRSVEPHLHSDHILQHARRNLQASTEVATCRVVAACRVSRNGSNTRRRERHGENAHGASASHT